MFVYVKFVAPGYSVQSKAITWSSEEYIIQTPGFKSTRLTYASVIKQAITLPLFHSHYVNLQEPRFGGEEGYLSMVLYYKVLMDQQYIQKWGFF